MTAFIIGIIIGVGIALPIIGLMSSWIESRMARRNPEFIRRHIDARFPPVTDEALEKELDDINLDCPKCKAPIHVDMRRKGDTIRALFAALQARLEDVKIEAAWFRAHYEAALAERDARPDWKGGDKNE